MAGIVTALARHQLVGLDTSVFIYHLEADTPTAEVATAALRAITAGITGGVTSGLSLMELTVKPLRLGRVDVADEYEMLVTNIPNLAVTDLDRSTLRRAAELRATFRLHPADAIQLAACLHHGATAFLTNDRDFRLVDQIEVLLLSTFVERDVQTGPGKPS